MTFKSLEWRPFTLLLPDIMLTFALPVALMVVLEALQSKSDQNSGIVNVAHGSEKYACYLPTLTMLLVASTSRCPLLQATGPSISVVHPASQQPSQSLVADNRPSHSSKRLGIVNMASTVAAVNRHGLLRPAWSHRAGKRVDAWCRCDEIKSLDIQNIIEWKRMQPSLFNLRTTT
jgi:hypothetical protein